LWDYSEQSVHLIFGIKTGNSLADKIYVLIKRAGGQLDKLEGINLLGRNVDKNRFDDALQVLVRVRLLAEEIRKQPVKGRPKIILRTLK